MTCIVIILNQRKLQKTLFLVGSRNNTWQFSCMSCLPFGSRSSHANRNNRKDKNTTTVIFPCSVWAFVSSLTGLVFPREGKDSGSLILHRSEALRGPCPKMYWIYVKLFKVAQMVGGEMPNKCRDKRVLVRLVRTIRKLQEFRHIFQTEVNPSLCGKYACRILFKNPSLSLTILHSTHVSMVLNFDRNDSDLLGRNGKRTSGQICKV